MFTDIGNIVESTTDLVGAGVESVVDNTRKIVKGVTPDASTIRGLIDTGMCIDELSDIYGVAIVVLEGILEG